MMKHKLLFVLEGTKVFMFQSGFLPDSILGKGRFFDHESSGLLIISVNQPEIDLPTIFVNGSGKKTNFTIDSQKVTPDQYDKLKELEDAYNDR